jgi:uncharacterized protein (DUF1810 family)
MKDINRFLEAQETTYQQALQEVKSGRKTSHWIWYIFPQIEGLGQSYASHYYGIEDIEEAKAYLQQPLLKQRLLEISNALLEVEGKTSFEIFGTLDAIKVQSSMTLFHITNPEEEVFKQVLDKYYDGTLDENTIEKLNTKSYQKEKGRGI